MSRTNPLAAIAIVAAFLLAGCAGTKDTDGNVTVGYDEGNVVTVKGPDGSTMQVPVTSDTGTVVGQVLDDLGQLVSGARVTASGGEQESITNESGWFQVAHVLPGKRALHAEAEGFQAATDEIIVEAGKVSQQTLTLLPFGDGGFRAHMHDHWGGQDTYTVFEGQAVFDSDMTAVPPHSCYLLYDSQCSGFEFLPEVGTIVPPGTEKLTVEINFVPSPLFDAGYEEYSFRIIPPTSLDGTDYYETIPITTGSTKVEYVLPATDIVDSGHAQQTRWRFYLNIQYDYTQGVGSINPGNAAYNALFRSPIDVSITANKGALVADPPHPRYWRDGAQLDMPASESAAYISCTAPVPEEEPRIVYYCGQRKPNVEISESNSRYCYPGCMVLGVGGLVPPGATRMEVEVDTWWGNSCLVVCGGVEQETLRQFAEPNEFRLGYKSANVPYREATWEDYKWLDAAGECVPDQEVASYWNAKCTRYSFRVSPEEVDPFYTQRSGLVFQFAVPGKETAPDWNGMCLQQQCGSFQGRLAKVTVFNDDWESLQQSMG